MSTPSRPGSPSSSTAHNNFFEEVAKFRAARRLWARIMKDRFKARKDASCMLRFHTQTAGCTLTAQQPENNVVRVALQALAAVLGGTQSLHTNSRDEAFALPTEESVMIALRTQQIIAYESGVADTDRPAGGLLCRRVPHRRDREEGRRVHREDRRHGRGRRQAVESGYMQKEIAESAYRYQKEIESGVRTVVGVNRFQVAEGPLMGTLRVSPEIERIPEGEAGGGEKAAG